LLYELVFADVPGGFRNFVFIRVHSWLE
jgi:hypothetical protein